MTLKPFPRLEYEEKMRSLEDRAHTAKMQRELGPQVTSMICSSTVNTFCSMISDLAWFEPKMKESKLANIGTI